MKKNIIAEKSFDFSLRIIKLYQFLTKEHKEYILAKQILRCGTSIGANIEEAIGAQSKKDFITKISISYKECRETSYWIKLLYKSNYLDMNLFHSLLLDCHELAKIITKILNTSKKNL
jgi:four helix bundle protein